MTENQKAALTDLRDGRWKFGNEIHGRNSLTSLHKLRLVNKNWGKRGRMEWQITPEGLKLLKELVPQILPPDMHVFTDANGPNE